VLPVGQGKKLTFERGGRVTCFKGFSIFTPKPVEKIQFDDPIFLNGLKLLTGHQPVLAAPAKGQQIFEPRNEKDSEEEEEEEKARQAAEEASKPTGMEDGMGRYLHTFIDIHDPFHVGFDIY